MAFDEEEGKALDEGEEITPGFEGGEFPEEEPALTDETAGEALSELKALENEKKKNRRTNVQALKTRRTIEDLLEKKRAKKELGDFEDYFDDEDKKE